MDSARFKQSIFSTTSSRKWSEPGFGLFSSSPTDGNFAAVNGFDGNGPITISLSQNIFVTDDAIINFDYRAGWDLSTFSTDPEARLFDVNINIAGGGANLANFNILTAASETIVRDTGDLFGSVDLSAFTGQLVELSFDWYVPQNFTGPAFFQLDNVRAAPEPFSLAILTLGLAWPKPQKKSVLKSTIKPFLKSPCVLHRGFFVCQYFYANIQKYEGTCVQG